MVSRSALFVGLDSSGNGATPADGRRALAGMYGTIARPLLIPGSTSSSSNMQITVAQNVWQLPDPTDSANTFISPMDSFVVTPAAGPGSGSRIDSIVIKQDNPQNGDTDPYSTPSLIAGTTAPPAIPAGYYEVARITVPAGASVATSTTVQFMNPVGLAPQELIASGASALALFNGSFVGQRALGLDGIEYRWNGSTPGWKPWDSLFVDFTGSMDLAGLAVGPATKTSRYRYWGGRVLFEGAVSLGSGGITSNAQLLLPVPLDAGPSVGQLSGKIVARNVSDTSGAPAGRDYELTWDTVSTTRLELHSLGASSNGVGSATNNPGIHNQITGSLPFNEAWASGDVISWQLQYDPA